MKALNILLTIAMLAALGCQGKRGGDSQAMEDTKDEAATDLQASEDEVDAMADAWIIEGEDTELTNTWAEDAYGGDSEDATDHYWVSESGDTVYKKTEVPPEFVGGQQALLTYFEDNVQYPDNAESGNVYVAFVVTDEGRISDARVVKGISDDMDREALRLIREMPAWDPAMYAGKTVHSVHGVPVPFNP